MKCCILRRPLLRVYCSFLRISVLRAFPNYSATSLFNITLKSKTKFVKSTDNDALLVKYSTDPNALPITLIDEEIRKKYPWDYRELTKQLKKRYPNFKVDRKYHNIRKGLKQDPRYCKTRYLDPENTKSLKKHFFNPEILKEFAIEYKK